MRPLLLVPCLFALASAPLCSAEPQVPLPAAPATTTITAAERSAINRVIEALIAVGVPDTRGATLVIGEIETSEAVAGNQTDPIDALDLEEGSEMNGHSFRYGGGRTRIADGKKITTWSGTHLQLADGRWLMQSAVLIAASPKLTITPKEDSKRLNPEQVATYLATDKPGRRHPGQDEGEASWLNLFNAEARPRIVAASAASAQLETLGVGLWGGSISVPLLCRAGVPGTAEMILLAGQMQQMDGFARMQRPDRQPLILDYEEMQWGARAFLGHEDGEAADPQAQMEKRKGTLTVVDPTPVLNQEIASWFHALLLDTASRTAFGFSSEQVAKQAIAFTPEADRGALSATLTLLAAARALPQKPPANADLATRLQSWLPSPQDQFMTEEGEEPNQQMPDAAMLAQMPADEQAYFRKEMERRNAWRPAEAEVPGLLALLTDPRPSRWIENGTPHTLGDNALRALHAVMRIDPRLLAGRDPLKPWDDAERTATAEAIRAWWTGVAGKPLAEALVADLEHLPLNAAITVISKRKPAERAPLLDRLAATLPATPTTDTSSQSIARLLALAGNQAGIAAKVTAWPIAGALRPLLAVWHNSQGRPAELDKLLDELGAAGNQDDQAASRLGVALKHALSKPSPERLQRSLALAAGPLTDRRTWAILGAVSGQGHAFDPDWMAVQHYEQNLMQQQGNRQHDEDRTDPALTIPLTVICTMLADRRILPDDAYKLQLHGDYGQIAIQGLTLGIQLRDFAQRRSEQVVEAKPRPNPSGLRVCDLAALAARNLTYQIGKHELASSPTNLWSGLTARDLAVSELAEAFAERARSALAAAKLPDVLPAARPVDDKALF